MLFMVKQPKKRGRPPVGDKPMTQLAVRFPDDMLDEIDAIVVERYGQADRTSVIRELVAQSLEARKRNPDAPPRRIKNKGDG